MAESIWWFSGNTSSALGSSGRAGNKMPPGSGFMGTAIH